MFKTLVIAASVLVSAYLIHDGMLKFRTGEKQVEVRGLAEKIVQSNEASWTITFSAQGNDLNSTNETYQRDQKILIKFFKDLGFDEVEIQKTPASIVDNWANLYGAQRPPNRITIRGAVSVNTSKVEAVAKAIERTDELIKLGVTFESSNTNYRFTDLNSVKSDMIKEANANARQSALNFSNDTGSALGKIKSASQGLFSITDLNSEYESNQSLNKKVRVVTQVSYYLE